MTDKRFCPKCKGEVNEKERFTVGHMTYDGYGTTYYEEGYRCLTCKESSMKRDCLTEEQVKKKSFYDEVVKWFSDAIDKVYDEESKQPPSFCFAEGKDGNKSANDTNVVTKTNENNDLSDEWINFSDRKPEIGQRIIYLSPASWAEEQIVWCKSLDRAGGWETLRWKPAQQESKPKECEHDWSDPDKFTLMQGDPTKQGYYREVGKSYCNQCGILKPKEKEKPQSQIAIEKVIEALEICSNRYSDCKKISRVLFNIQCELQELNK